MKLKRTQLLEAPGWIRSEVEASHLGLEDFPTVISGTCPLELQISQAGSETRVKGSVQIVLQETCDRCLTQFDHELTGRFTLILTEDRSLYSREADDVYLFPPSQVEFDLGPVIRDAVRLERPMKQLCKEDCRGLCPRCGTNRNETDCGCQEKTVDMRWAPLRALQQSDSEG
ncbi:MAG: DUF177 domain-containing protein [Fidelibacterota bacterium]